MVSTSKKQCVDAEFIKKTKLYSAYKRVTIALRTLKLKVKGQK
jgi:hypothetical protein